ncbi:hypothetical protein N480_14660 [Pseudoalteromonas luteoviolacea S2607]|uniref:antibiotic biosynthesis monooxygenase family protein n=1 Tax=Pseudoalteromonas luteoviolacea TaxID=43657 RepID=UPI0007B043A9|nr:hypothetical protein [Pseudoalteromonas luteoviolacea]KZN37982.1 hypothetical protein N480_14660 [Pseudoalteromonas luteoviolacea S2607]
MPVRITLTMDRNKVTSPLKITKLERKFKGEHKYGNSKYNEFHFNKGKLSNSKELYKLVDKYVIKNKINYAEFCVITLCKIKNNDSKKFLEQFFSVLPHMKESPGFVDFRLYKSKNKNQNFNYINIATWSCIKELEITFTKIKELGLLKGGFDSTSEIAICNLPEIKKD